ncbi:hypothetical protein GPECTOR_168g177 [Gonium pectorale]|uniref:B12-dependent ribonucleotide reductase insertion domain-containing protein n=1 Tax=Gonium pectorale TaxID=33097 RepID=A0A150FXD3_GONPE|nr:hypothetical protein GPECTOR_168g177 [Gonium pectorale]|eukprot:KXZ42284.1 hypothetical protein GPECTOR_168g177 [Gonium pectorale]
MTTAGSATGPISCMSPRRAASPDENKPVAAAAGAAAVPTSPPSSAPLVPLLAARRAAKPPPKLQLFPLPPKDQSVLRDQSNTFKKGLASSASPMPAAKTAAGEPTAAEPAGCAAPPSPVYSAPSVPCSSTSLSGDGDAYGCSSSSAGAGGPLSPLPLQRGLPTDYQAFIHTSRYARWIEHKARRETWPETVNRYLDFMTKHLRDTCGWALPGELRAELFAGIIELEPFAFDEALFVLMNGTGVGYSVEADQVAQLPPVAERFVNSSTTVVVQDSREGWARALREVLALLWSGQIPRWDTSQLRPKGARLRTFGGRASGPEPLEALFLFAVQLFQKARGRRLTPLECHDLVCKVAEIVVVGGVRRSALISLSDVGDAEMRAAKAGAWWEEQPQRAMANNSAVYKEERPPVGVFMAEWMALYNSGSGERGLFSRAACERQVARTARRQGGHAWGTNPCSEIILRPYQFCNLTEVVVRASDDASSLARKVRLATVLGTFQATMVNFPYLRDVWRSNTESERLLGVSLTGIMDNTLTSGRQGMKPLESLLAELRTQAVAANAELSAELGVPPSAAITCVKPSGTVSQLVDAASGIHPRHAPYYIRRVRCTKDDPLTAFMAAHGVPVEDCVMRPDSTAIFSFPIKSPEGAVTRDDVSALSQLQLCLAYQRHWCEHKPSITVTVREEEWMDVGAWVYRHFDELSGVSFLPYDCGSYKQMPYEAVDRATYEELVARMPRHLDWAKLRELERGPGADEKMEGELACTAGGCEQVDIA